MKNLEHQRCFNHASREAAARCPDCGRFFCRECVTEHEDKVLCMLCLEKKAESAGIKKTRFPMIRQALIFLSGFFLLWMVFYYMGKALLMIPTAFHKGGLW